MKRQPVTANFFNQNKNECITEYTTDDKCMKNKSKDLNY